MEERQRRADMARGRGGGDDTPPDAAGKPKKKSPFKYEFGEPEPDAQEDFTDQESRIMKHAGGRRDYSRNAQAAARRDAGARVRHAAPGFATTR
jgi:hypothetical protein